MMYDSECIKTKETKHFLWLPIMYFFLILMSFLKILWRTLKIVTSWFYHLSCACWFLFILCMRKAMKNGCIYQCNRSQINVFFCLSVCACLCQKRLYQFNCSFRYCTLVNFPWHFVLVSFINKKKTLYKCKVDIIFDKILIR